MEDTLRDICVRIVRIYTVLILVLLEDTLRAEKVSEKISQECLNPCFNGRYSQSTRH